MPSLTVINLRAAEQAQGSRLPWRRQAEGVGDDHRAIDGDGVLWRRRGRAPVPQLRAEGHLHGSTKHQQTTVPQNQPRQHLDRQAEASTNKYYSPEPFPDP